MRCQPPLDDMELAAAERSLADEVIAKLPKGYDQVIGKRFRTGIDLSGGEWQKIAIARAYMRDAQVLILDEPTAALDARAEFEVFQRFKDLAAGKSAVIISHRFSTVRMADRIARMLKKDSHFEVNEKDHTCNLTDDGVRKAEEFAGVEEVLAVDGPWMITFDPAVQPEMEFPTAPPAAFTRGVEKPLEDWSAWGLRKFSGLLDYAKTVSVEKPEPGMSLDLGKVGHAAEVWVNGLSCGSRLWGPRWRLPPSRRCCWRRRQLARRFTCRWSNRLAECLGQRLRHWSWSVSSE